MRSTYDCDISVLFNLVDYHRVQLCSILERKTDSVIEQITHDMKCFKGLLIKKIQVLIFLA